MEAERTRIAQDLHDELGSGITEISMLAARAKSVTAPGEKREQYLDHVGRTARELVTALDEIVWAMNPRHDSLASLVSYFSFYADRFLGLAGIAWRLTARPVRRSEVPWNRGAGTNCFWCSRKRSPTWCDIRGPRKSASGFIVNAARCACPSRITAAGCRPAGAPGRWMA
jgi:signal transduction histidine kinase